MHQSVNNSDNSYKYNFRISSTNHHVIYINNSLFGRMKNTVNQVKNIYKKNCGIELGSLCQQKSCNTTLAIYVTNLDSNPSNTIDPITPATIENYLYKNILGFLTVELYNNYGEIYNVCTSINAREKGVMKSVLKSLLVDIPKDKIWLGIDIKNPIRDKVIRLYLSVGFNPRGIQYITPSGTFPSFPFISLVYNKGNPIDISKDVVNNIGEHIKKMVQQYNKRGGRCSVTTYMRPELISEIKNNYITSNIEHGGIIGVKRLDNGKYLLGLAVTTKGNDNFFTVKIPTYYINWHTHPLICYQKNLCYIGWPSGQDMSLLIRSYNDGLLAHILFANEGVYFLQLSPDMMIFIRSIPSQCVNILGKMIKYFFENLENFRNINYDQERIRCLNKVNDIRCLTYDTKQKNISIQNIVNIIHKTKLSDILNSSSSNSSIQQSIYGSQQCIFNAMKNLNKSSNIPIFQVQYTPMNQATQKGIETHINYYMAPINSTCPIPEYLGKANYGGGGGDSNNNNNNNNNNNPVKMVLGDSNDSDNNNNNKPVKMNISNDGGLGYDEGYGAYSESGNGYNPGPWGMGDWY